MKFVGDKKALSGRSVKLTTYFHLVLRSRNTKLYLYSPIGLLSVLFISLRTGESLPFILPN
jgi:hypothetical protein